MMTAKAEFYDKVMDFDSGYFEELLESTVAFYIYKKHHDSIHCWWCLYVIK